MRILFTLFVLAFSLGGAFGQCASGLNTPEFPIGTHPSDQNTQSWGTNLFTPAQFGPAANITGIQVYVDNSFGPTTYANQTIWMRHTAVSSYPNANYPTTTGFTQVYSGSYNFPMSGLVTLPFNVSSFAYNGTSNVEILFENRSNVYRANEPWFRRTASYGASVYRSQWNGNFGFGGFPGTGSNGSAVRLTYTLSLTSLGAGGCGRILPVTLAYFGAEPSQAGVVLAWEAAEQDHLATYALERSQDGSSFAEIHRGMQLSYLDTQPVAGMNYYRLRMWDQDGIETLSGVIEADATAPQDDYLKISQRVDGGLQLAFMASSTQHCKVELFDLQGKTLHATSLDAKLGWNIVDLHSIGSSSGIVMARVVGEDQTWIGRSFLID